MGLKDTITRVGTKAADKVAKLASLSPEQLEKVQADREKYLSEMPDPTDSTAKEQTGRLLAACSVEIYKEYLAHLQEFYVPVEAQAEYEGRPFDTARNICFVNITKWVVDKNENSLEKLVNVYEVLSNEECNIALIFHRTCETTHVTLAVTNTKNDDNNVEARSFRDRLAAAVRGNFPGAELAQTDGAGIPPCLKQDGPRSVAIASNVPGEKSEKFLSQTIEKLIDGIVPESRSREYVLILMATPILDVETRKLNLQEYYSALAPYASWTTNFTYDEHSATGSSATVGVNVGASAGVQNGTNQSYTDTYGTADTTGSSFSESTSSSVTDTTGTTDTSGTTYTEGTNSSVEVGESLTKTKGLSYIATATRAKGTSTSATTGTSASEAVTSSVAKSVSQSVASTAGNAVTQSLSKAVSNSLSRTAGIFKSVSTGVNFGASFARSSTVTATIGKSEGIQQTFTNYNIKHALEILEQQMKRLELSTALGLWDFAAYVMSEDHITAGNVAHTYLALTQGEESYMSQASVNIWRGDTGENGGRAAEICRYLQQLRHPVFGLDPGLTGEEEELKSYPPVAAATTSLSGKELAYALNFPQKSVSGLPVIECAGFGRNVTTYDPVHANSTPFALGQVFHMLREERTAVDLSADSLTAHTFITGSTGSGKSNTIYQILNEALANDVRFLVIEPAKGEYKHVFGMEESVSVYGTNPALTPLLRLNPFSFPKQIHILEHLDRLVEIFNVCWPMYAAMPAVLKRAVEQSYIDSGWDLLLSENKYDDALYPTFADVARNIKEVIDTSEYDAENKGAYKGSLLTRLDSLTTGINGMIFTCDEITAEDLFDQNVIIDLSRVGSTETKSLLMGMLVLKQQEYRMAEGAGMNRGLRHITVLEEAHNLLKRTPLDQSSESANLCGKSVEMLANAIAEMRTYGEGFIIADQAPGLLDLSVIRNTNTKIIMRLPDADDRELTGRAANLNDDQITELARLPRGVAAVYQNEWVQPVLCKVRKYDGPQEPYTYTPPQGPDRSDAKERKLSEALLDCIMNKEIYGTDSRKEIRSLREPVLRSKLPTRVKTEFIAYIDSGKAEAVIALRRLLYDFFNAEEAIRTGLQCDEIERWAHAVADALRPSVQKYSQEQVERVMVLILREQMQRDPEYGPYYLSYVELHREKGGVW